MAYLSKYMYNLWHLWGETPFAGKWCERFEVFMVQTKYISLFISSAVALLAAMVATVQQKPQYS